MADKLQEYRDEIVEINEKILGLLSKRGKIAQRLVKKNANKVHLFTTHNAKKK